MICSVWIELSICKAIVFFKSVFFFKAGFLGYGPAVITIQQ